MPTLRLNADPSGIVSGFATARTAASGLLGDIKKLETRIDNFSTATRQAGVSAASMTRDLQKLNRQAAAGGGTVAKFTREMRRMKGVNQGTAGGLQNVSFQVQDFAVQVGAGTSAAQALGQQLPQLLSGFGLMGILLGTAAAIFVPLISYFITGGEKAKSFADQLDMTSEALEQYQERTQLSVSATSALIDEFGAASPALRQALIDLAAIEKVKAYESFDALASSMREIADTAWWDTRSTESAISDMLRLSSISSSARQTSAELVAQLNTVSSSTATMEQRVNAASAAMDTLREHGGDSFERLGVGGEELVAALAEIIIKGEQFIDTSASMPDGVNAAAAAASRLADELTRAVDKANELALAGLNSQETARIKYDFRNDPIGEAAALARLKFDSTTDVPQGADSTVLNVIESERQKFVAAEVEAARYTEALAAWRKEQRAITKAGNTSANELEKLANKYDALASRLDPLRAASIAYAKAQEIIAAAVVTGRISHEEAADTLEKVQTQYEKVSTSAKIAASGYGDFVDASGDAIDGLIRGTDNWRDSLKGLVVELGYAIIKARLLKTVSGATSDMSVGQIITQGLSGLFGGFFDGGGTLAAGMTGIVGEYGPEIVTATSTGAVITSRNDTAKQLRGMRSASQQNVQVGVTVDDDGKIQAYVKENSRNAAIAGAQAAVRDVKTNFGNWQGQLNRDGVLA